MHNETWSARVSMTVSMKTSAARLRLDFITISHTRTLASSMLIEPLDLGPEPGVNIATPEQPRSSA